MQQDGRRQADVENNEVQRLRRILGNHAAPIEKPPDGQQHNDECKNGDYRPHGATVPAGFTRRVCMNQLPLASVIFSARAFSAWATGYSSSPADSQANCCMPCIQQPAFVVLVLERRTRIGAGSRADIARFGPAAPTEPSEAWRTLKQMGWITVNHRLPCALDRNTSKPGIIHREPKSLFRHHRWQLCAGSRLADRRIPETR
jgi:hypothetical protein